MKMDRRMELIVPVTCCGGVRSVPLQVVLGRYLPDAVDTERSAQSRRQWSRRYLQEMQQLGRE